MCKGRKHVCVRTSACRVQKWVSDPLELGSEAAVAAVGAGLDLGSPARAAHAVDAEPSLQTSYFSVLKKYTSHLENLYIHKTVTKHITQYLLTLTSVFITHLPKGRYQHHELLLQCVSRLQHFPQWKPFYIHTRGIVWDFHIISKNSTAELSPEVLIFLKQGLTLQSSG